MSSYELHPTQERQVAELITTHSTTLAEKIARAVKDTAQHGRGSVVTISLKVAWDKDKSHLITVEVQEKIKHPKSQFTDQTSWTEPAIETAFDTSQEHGQQRVPGA